MTASLVLVLLIGVMYTVGVYLMLERSMTKVLLGFLLLGNATNLLIIAMSGPAGTAPFFGAEGTLADPLPQAFVLTAIVITFGISAFLMALIYRSWRLSRVDVVEDDLDDVTMASQDASTTESTDATSDDTEFGTRATAAVSTALDLEEVERLEEQKAAEEARVAEEAREALRRAKIERDEAEREAAERLETQRKKARRRDADRDGADRDGEDES